MASIVLENVFKNYKGKPDICAIAGCDLVIPEGELLVLIGPSGCGKTTLLRLIAGLEEPSEGQILFNGDVFNKVPAEKRNVAMVSQSPSLFPHLTVFENIAFGLMLRKTPETEIRRSVHNAAKILELESILNRNPHKLSGGQAQRVALARSLVRNPTVFLFDEPLSNLDGPNRIHLRREIVKLQRQLGVTTIYVTHDQSEAMAMGGLIAVMKEGKIQQVGKPLEIYHRPANKFIAGFFGAPSMNFFSGCLTHKNDAIYFENEIFSVAFPSDRFKSSTDQQVIMGIRPENISATQMHSDNSFDAVVESIEPAGAQTQLLLRNKDQLFTASVSSDLPWELNQKVSSHFDMSHVHFFDAPGVSLALPPSKVSCAITI